MPNPTSAFLSLLPIGAAVLLTGCAECTQVILGKGDLSNFRPPHQDWTAAKEVKLIPESSLFDIVPGKGAVVNGSSGEAADLITTAEYGDVKLSYEFLVPPGSEPRVMVMGRYELDVPETSLAAGEWQRMEVVFRAPRFDRDGRKIENARFKRVALNNETLHRDLELSGPTCDDYFPDEQPYGPLIARGDTGPIAIRNLRITPMHLP